MNYPVVGPRRPTPPAGPLAGPLPWQQPTDLPALQGGPGIRFGLEIIGPPTPTQPRTARFHLEALGLIPIRNADFTGSGGLLFTRDLNTQQTQFGFRVQGNSLQPVPLHRFSVGAGASVDHGDLRAGYMDGLYQYHLDDRRYFTTGGFIRRNVGEDNWVRRFGAAYSAQLQPDLYTTGRFLAGQNEDGSFYPVFGGNVFGQIPGYGDVRVGGDVRWRSMGFDDPEYDMTFRTGSHLPGQTPTTFMRPSVTDRLGGVLDPLADWRPSSGAPGESLTGLTPFSDQTLLRRTQPNPTGATMPAWLQSGSNPWEINAFISSRRGQDPRFGIRGFYVDPDAVGSMGHRTGFEYLDPGSEPAHFWLQSDTRHRPLGPVSESMGNFQFLYEQREGNPYRMVPQWELAEPIQWLDYIRRHQGHSPISPYLTPLMTPAGDNR